MNVNKVGVIGATSQVGGCLLRLLSQSEYRTIAFSRQIVSQVNNHVEWRQLSSVVPAENSEEISNWIITVPIWVLPEYFDLLETLGAKKIVALSSTSRFTKLNSINISDQDITARLIEGESALQIWAEEKGIQWTILRPTLIYGLGNDTNVSEIIRFVDRWGFFPLLGKCDGQRQPVHVEDVAKACLSAMTSTDAINQAYNISGAERFTYREMVSRVFLALGKRPRFLHLPRWCFRIALCGLRVFPRYRHWSVTMADRMSLDMIFDYSSAQDAFNYSPRQHFLDAKDLPIDCGK